MSELFFAPPYSAVMGPVETAIVQGLSDDWRVHGLQYPPYVSRAPGGEAFEEIVQAALDQIEAAKLDGPLFIAGLSFGSHVAFEVAARTALAGRPVAFVGLLFGFAFPVREDWRRSFGVIIQRSFRADRRAGAGLTLAVTKQPGNWARWAQRYAATITAQSDRLFWLNHFLYAGLRFFRLHWRAEEFREKTNRVLRLKAMVAFPASRYPGRVWLLRPDDLPPPVRAEDLGWSSLGAKVEVRRVPLSPHTFWAQENLPLIAAALDEALNASKAGGARLTAIHQ